MPKGRKLGKLGYPCNFKTGWLRSDILHGQALFKRTEQQITWGDINECTNLENSYCELFKIQILKKQRK